MLVLKLHILKFFDGHFSKEFSIFRTAKYLTSGLDFKKLRKKEAAM